MSILKVIGAALGAGYACWRAERRRDRALSELRALRRAEPAILDDLGAPADRLGDYVDGRLSRPNPPPRLVVDNARDHAARLQL